VKRQAKPVTSCVAGLVNCVMRAFLDPWRWSRPWQPLVPDRLYSVGLRIVVSPTIAAAP